jgi:hypothetical protein
MKIFFIYKNAAILLVTNLLTVTKVECWEKLKRTLGLLRTFEDFEFRAAFTDRKNTPTFAAVMIQK